MRASGEGNVAYFKRMAHWYKPMFIHGRLLVSFFVIRERLGPLCVLDGQVEGRAHWAIKRWLYIEREYGRKAWLANTAKRAQPKGVGLN